MKSNLHDRTLRARNFLYLGARAWRQGLELAASFASKTTFVGSASTCSVSHCSTGAMPLHSCLRIHRGIDGGFFQTPRKQEQTSTTSLLASAVAPRFCLWRQGRGTWISSVAGVSACVWPRAVKISWVAGDGFYKSGLIVRLRSCRMRRTAITWALLAALFAVRVNWPVP